jgi:hypothetical protein
MLFLVNFTGARVSQAFANAQDFTKAVELFQNEKYMVTYRPSRQRAYVVIKDSATSEDVLRAAFQVSYPMTVVTSIVEWADLGVTLYHGSMSNYSLDQGSYQHIKDISVISFDLKHRY